MNDSACPDSGLAGISGRTDAIFEGHLDADYRLVDRMFAILLFLEWLAAIVVALVVSRLAWVGEAGITHFHVRAALFLGGVTVSLPIVLTLARPGRAMTRQCVAVGQMLMVALLIHLSGGRPEAHFHVFGSLAFLALYRDWRVLVTAGLVVALDHYLRGVYRPRSVFGLLAAVPWRWAEHSLWVAFEGSILAFGMNRSRTVMREAARRQAEVEATRDRVELRVAARTAELRLAQAELGDRVRERTVELQHANDSLRDEIAERRKVEDDLRASEKRFRDLAEALPQIVWCTDAEGVNDYFNARWYEYTGLSPEESLGYGWVEILHPDDRELTRRVWAEAVTDGSSYQIEYRILRCEDRTYRWHLGRGLPIAREDGSIVRWFGTCTDIDDQKCAAESLRQSNDRLEGRVRDRTAALERANADLLAEVAERRKAELEALRSREVAEHATRAKSEFLANMSHEIRTPMNAIIGMTELTLGMELPPEQRDNLEVVRVAADALLELIDDILDFSKIEAGKLDLEPVRFPPRGTIDEALKTLSLRARNKGLSLVSFVAPEVPEVLIGDPFRLRQVLLNLLGNAIKFTARGRVEVRVDVEGGGPGSVSLRFSVLDEGIGIPESRLSMIFDPFNQADGSTTRRFGGTGLGLSISTRLVELMGGSIWVESEVGRGSAFHFTALFGAAMDLATGPDVTVRRAALRPDASDGRSLRLLLGDDNELNRRVGLLLLQRLGHRVHLAVDGTDAIAKYEDEGPFDLVLMDIQMPGMDGIEATSHIRAIQERQGRRCPIVALTAFAMKGDRERFQAAGMDEHLAKPVRADDLARVISSVIADEGRPVHESPSHWCRDPEAIRASFPMGDVQMAEIVGIFRETCVEQMAGMGEAIAEQDPVALARAAHGLIGCLGMFGSGATLALASGLEAAGRSGDISDVGETLSRLEEAMIGMRPTLDELAEIREADGLPLAVADHPGSIGTAPLRRGGESGRKADPQQNHGFGFAQTT